MIYFSISPYSCLPKWSCCHHNVPVDTVGQVQGGYEREPDLRCVTSYTEKLCKCNLCSILPFQICILLWLWPLKEHCTTGDLHYSLALPSGIVTPSTRWNAYFMNAYRMPYFTLKWAIKRQDSTVGSGFVSPAVQMDDTGKKQQNSYGFLFTISVSPGSWGFSEWTLPSCLKKAFNFEE